MRSSFTTTAALLLLPSTILAATLDCEHIRADGQSFHFKKLGGPKTVHFLESSPPTLHNTSFTLDICNPLPFDKEIKKEEQCSPGTWICGIDREYRAGAEVGISRVIDIAGSYATSNGRALDPKPTRLNGSDSHADAGLEGVRLELHGGRYVKQDQKAIIEFVCDHDLEGTEGFDSEKTRRARRRDIDGQEIEDGEGDGKDDDDEDEPLPTPDKGKALQFVSYKPERDETTTVLRLKWSTKYACESEAGDKPDDDGHGENGGKSSGGWGFFTWFLIIVFLLAATYIIFGSWLNYNRYGARGWDLVPHGDTIRDLPYIIKDLFGALVEKVRGGGSRGGYSAVSL